jgi:signal transduction histidine kinase
VIRRWSLTTRRIDPFHFDVALALLLLVGFEIDIVTTHTHRGPLVLNIIFAGAISLATVWRRRAPLASASVVMALGAAMAAWLTNPTTHVVPIYLLFVPAYSVGAYEPRKRALAGLAVCFAGPWVMVATATHSTASDWAFTAGMSTAAWVVGRALRARRFLNAELAAKTERLAAERESRERLAVADERTRIARELHAVVAASVSAMVVQTEVAQHLLDEDPDRADDAMAAVETAGRQTLAEMRRILGVLRRTDEDPATLAPQPGVGQIAALVERARADGRDVALDVEGEPGPLPASVDLGVYRILEDALASAGAGRLGVRLAFSEGEVELSVTAGEGEGEWPTLAMRERVALCDGTLSVADGCLDVRLPRAFDEVFA